MNGPLRSTPDMKADGAERAPVRLAKGDAVPTHGGAVPTRAGAAQNSSGGGVLLLERPGASAALDDIVAARMKDLAERLAAGKALQKSADVDALLTQSDVEIQPVSLAAIAGLRGRAMTDADDDDWLPAPQAQIAPMVPSDADTAMVPSRASTTASAPAPLSLPTMSIRSSETVSEQNLQSLLAVLDRPTPLRLAGELPPSRQVSADPPAVLSAASVEEADRAVVVTTEADTPTDLLVASGSSDASPWTDPAPAADAPLLLADQSATDIRLVDLIKRQQSLLEQLNRYPPAPVTTEVSTDVPANPPTPQAPVPAWFVVDQLAPTPPVVAADTPPPLPPTGVLHLPAPLPDDDEHQLPERAPMIIERARAERSAHHGARNSATTPSPLPAFAAGIAIALAIAGSLLFVL